MSALEVSVKDEGGVRRLEVVGDATIYTAAELKAQLLPALEACTGPELELDLSRISELDTAGLQVLLLVKRESGAVNKDLRLGPLSDPVVYLLRLYNIASYFGVSLPPAPPQGAGAKGKPAGQA